MAYLTSTTGTLTGINSFNDSTAATTANWITYDSTATISITSGTNIYYNPNQYNQYITNAGTAINFGIVQDKKVIHPQLYFKFVKSKMTKLEQKEMTERLFKLQSLVKQAENLGQKALYEDFARKIAITVREQEINVCGIEYIISKDSVDKYKDKVKDVDIRFSKLEEYSRPIPANVKKRLDKFKKLMMFDNYMVLYLDYKEKIDIDNKKKAVAEPKTNKQKIKEKDPILFGTLDYESDKLYFIADWIDEYCDLTLDKFVQTIKKNDPEYELDGIDEIDEEYIQKMVKESRERFVRLKKTDPSTYKKLMVDEDMSYLKKLDQKKPEKQKKTLKEIISQKLRKGDK
jgi:hypothetical protein